MLNFEYLPKTFYVHLLFLYHETWFGSPWGTTNDNFHIHMFQTNGLEGSCKEILWYIIVGTILYSSSSSDR